jgi:flagellar biosynthesis/type III secretory pathway protein FliH
MELSQLPPDKVAAILSQIFGDKDPATVGLRKIVSRKVAEAADFPMRVLQAEEFTVAGRQKKLLTEDESRLIELEREVARLKQEITQRTGIARQAVQKAYTQGFEHGSVKGRAAASAEESAIYQKKIAVVQERVSGYLNALDHEKRSLYGAADKTMLALCGQIVKKILGSEMVRQDAVLSVLKKALTYIAERDKLVIRVAPLDIEAVSGNKDFWVPVTDRLKEITIEPDERIERGGCIIESVSGIVDARLGVQMQAMTELVEKAWNAVYLTEENTVETGGA